MQRTALQGHPRVLTAITHRYIANSPTRAADPHPFRLKFHELPIGYQLKTKSREITMDDIEHFARFTGDTFYAHLDEETARANPLFGVGVATAISFSRSRPACLSIRRPGRCWPITASTLCGL